MDLRTLLRILARRWLVVLPTILVAVLVGAQLLSQVEPEYEAKGSILILKPVTAADDPAVGDGIQGDEFIDNPLDDLTAGLDRTAGVFATIMNDGRQKRAIRDQGGTTDYEVTVDEDTPILNVTATDDRPRIAIETVNAVLEAIPAQILLREDQLKVAADDRLVTDVLASPDRATTLNAAKTRALVAFIALGVAAVLSVALLVESWSQSAQTRRERRRLTVAVPGPTPVPSAAGPAPVPTPGAATPAHGPTPAGPVKTASPQKRVARSASAKANDASPSSAPASDDGERADESASQSSEGSRGASSKQPQPGRARAKPRRRNPAAS